MKNNRNQILNQKTIKKSIVKNNQKKIKEYHLKNFKINFQNNLENNQNNLENENLFFFDFEKRQVLNFLKKNEFFFFTYELMNGVKDHFFNKRKKFQKDEKLELNEIPKNFDIFNKNMYLEKKKIFDTQIYLENKIYDF